MATLNPFQYVLNPNIDGGNAYEIEKKQQLVDALRQQALNPAPMQNAGAIVPSQSFITPLVQALAGYVAGKQQNAINQQIGNISQQSRQRQQDALKGLLGQDQPSVQPSTAPQQSVAPQPAAQPEDGMKAALAKANAALAAGVPKEVVDAYIDQAKKQFAPVDYQHSQNGGYIFNPRTGKAQDFNGQALTDEQVKQRELDIKTAGPMDEVAKLNADLEKGRISISDYNKRKELITTRAPNMYSDLGDQGNGDDVAKMIANYQIAPPSPMRMQTPQGQALLAKVLKNNPDYQAEEYGSRVSAYKSFSSGKQGDQVRSFNVGISHLHTAQELADALGNTDTRILNRIANKWAEETGSEAPTNLDTAKEVIKGEIVKAVSGAGGGVADREKALAGIDKASSPAQLKGAIETAQKLMGGQLGGLKRQYEQSTGRKDFERLLSEDSKPYLNTKEGTGNSNTGKGPVKINSDDDYSKLPSGAEFIGPDGVHRKKP